MNNIFKMRLLTFSLIFFLTCVFTSANAQYKKREWHVYGGPSVGAMYYIGELSKSSLPSNGYVKPSIGARLSVQYKSVIAFQASYTFGGLAGYDSLVSEARAQRGYEFTTQTHDVEMFMKVTLLNHNKKLTRRQKTVFHPKLLLGIGMLNFAPKREYNGQTVDLRTLGTGGQNFGGTYPEPYGNWALGLKIGGEYSFQTGPRTFIDFYWHYTATRTDYLDDVGGGPHIDVADLESSGNAELLSNLAYAEVFDGDVPSTPGNTRGNPLTNDGYFNFGFAVSYRFTDVARGNRGNSLPFRSRMRF